MLLAIRIQQVLYIKVSDFGNACIMSFLNTLYSKQRTNQLIMKKSLLILILGCLLYGSGWSQTAYYNAKTLYALNTQELADLQPYQALLTLDQDKEDWEKLQSFVRNPFAYIQLGKKSFNIGVLFKLRDLQANYEVNINGAGKMLFLPKNARGGYRSQFDVFETTTNLIDAVLGTNVGPEMDARLIDATATLLYDRTRAELTLSYLSRLKEAFDREISIKGQGATNERTSIYLRDLFPSTYSILLDFERVLSVNVGKSLQNALEEDLKDFFEHADQYLIPESTKQLLPYQLLTATYYAFSDLSRGKHPALILTAMTDRFPIDDIPQPVTDLEIFSFSLHLMNAVSRSMEDISPDRTWISFDDFRRMNVREFEYYLCLLYLENLDLFNGLGINANKLDASDKDFNKLRNLIYRTVEFIDQIENKIADSRVKTATRKQPSQITFYDGTTTAGETSTTVDRSGQNRLRAFYEYSSMMLDLVEHTADYVCWFDPEHSMCSSSFRNQYMPMSRELSEIPLYVENKEYATAFLKTFKLVKLLNQENEGFEIPDGLIKYLTLAADVVAADSVKEIKSILDGAILPVGTFRVKRYSTRSVFINAYVGAGAGAEWLDAGGINEKWGYHFSPFALLGVDFSWGSQKPSTELSFQTKGNSSGFFVSVLDLGAVVSYRFQGERTDSLQISTLPPIRWEQILSPGIFYVRGFKNSPISWGLGAQLSPQLRDITNAEGETLTSANAFRFSSFIAVDLPLFTVSSKNKKIQSYEEGNIEEQIELLNDQIQALNNKLLYENNPKRRKEIEKQIKQKRKEIKRLARKL